MTDDQYTKMTTEAKHQETIFVSRMVGVEEPQGVLIQEDGLSLLKRDFVLLPVLLALRLIPLESYFSHTYNVLIIRLMCKRNHFLLRDPRQRVPVFLFLSLG